MILIHISGGMGNQMLMYAAGLSTAKRLNTELFLSTPLSRKTGEEADLMNRDNRAYCLDCFPNIDEKEASFKDVIHSSFWLMVNFLIHRRKIEMRNIFKRLLRKIIAKFNLGYYAQNPEKYGQSYNPEFEKIPDNTLVWGVWESEKHFKNIAGLVRQKFTFDEKCFDKKLLAQVQNCNSVALHVRRGDKAILDVHTPSTDEYIKLAVEKIYELTKEPEFFVFSDDLDWCREILPKIRDINWHFIENQTPPQDMALMTKCKHVIVAPSTFSWWGAWLNDNPDKIIIAPKMSRWGKVQEGNRDLLPENWIKL